MTRKKLALTALAAGLAVGLGLLLFLWYWSATAVERDPVGAAKAGMDRVMDLPDPASIGFLGVVEAGETSYDCSGTVELETTDQGLRVDLRDCTVGDETQSQTFSLYADPTQAAFYAGDSQSNGAWLGVDLTRPLADQAAGTAYETLYTQDQRREHQAAADALAEALSAVTALDFAAEQQSLLDFLAQAQSSAERTPGGYSLLFSEDDVQRVQDLCQALSLPEGRLIGVVTVDVGLTSEGVLQRVAVDSWDLDVTLELGAAPDEELVPRLEASWTDSDGQSWTVTMALTVDRGQSLTPPPFENALARLG